MNENEIINRCAYCSSIKDWSDRYNDRIKIPMEMNAMGKTQNISDGICDKCLNLLKMVKSEWRKNADNKR